MTPKHVQEIPPMLDVILKQYLKLYTSNNLEHHKSDLPPPLNWKAVCNSVPKTTPEMCQKRFYQLNAMLRRSAQELGVGGYFSPGEILISGRDSSDTLYKYVHSLFNEEAEKHKASSSEQSTKTSSPDEYSHDETSKKYQNTRESVTTTPSPVSTAESSSKSRGGPSMVIHVCDEAKNLRQDFTCPRDLLIQEMKYFAEYLSVDSQRLEEVDISVHCDIHIFDWLMRYVKRDTGLIKQDDVPRLEPSNVISILISSDFLKMETLVEECITYCHYNLSAIVATPCNMNCVNDRLAQRIAMQFTHNKLEDVKDRKDKFKSKIFCKKIEKLFDPKYENVDSPGNASTLFKCKACGRLLTEDQRIMLPCTNNRMKINQKGGLVYEHEINKTWDISSFIISLYDDLKKWSYVYWRLWGIVNTLNCSRCNMNFQLTEYGHCQYHPEKAQFRKFENNEVINNPIGFYPCCSQRVLRFDPTGLNKGCRVRDHVVFANGTKDQRLLDDIILHKSLVQIPHKVNNLSSDLNMFGDEEIVCGVKTLTLTPAEIIPTPQPLPKLIPTTTLKVTKTVSSGDNYYTGLADTTEEDMSDEDIVKPKSLPHSFSSSSQMSTLVPPLPLVSLRPQAPIPSGQTQNSTSKLAKKSKDKSPHLVDNTVYNKFPNKLKWESARSVRWNQDVQREEDMRRLQDITMQLAKQRHPEKTEKTKNKDTREYPGGIFSKLEANFFSNYKANASSTSGMNRQVGLGNPRDRLPRGRPTQVRF